MPKKSDQLAGGFDTENAGGLLTGLLAEEDNIDRRAMFRLGTWGVVSVGAVIVAVLANQSAIKTRRDDVAALDLTRQSMQISAIARESQNETRRLASAIDTLYSDRDRMYTRLTGVEQGLEFGDWRDCQTENDGFDGGACTGHARRKPARPRAAADGAKRGRRADTDGRPGRDHGGGGTGRRKGPCRGQKIRRPCRDGCRRDPGALACSIAAPGDDLGAAGDAAIDDGAAGSRRAQTDRGGATNKIRHHGACGSPVANGATAAKSRGRGAGAEDRSVASFCARADAGSRKNRRRRKDRAGRSAIACGADRGQADGVRD